jgi:hypothetical protein
MTSTNCFFRKSPRPITHPPKMDAIYQALATGGEMIFR